jgi:hypothetical protein
VAASASASRETTSRRILHRGFLSSTEGQYTGSLKPGGKDRAFRSPGRRKREARSDVTVPATTK